MEVHQEVHAALGEIELPQSLRPKYDPNVEVGVEVAGCEVGSRPEVAVGT